MSLLVWVFEAWGGGGVVFHFWQKQRERPVPV